jgi:hypothetical protein
MTIYDIKEQKEEYLKASANSDVPHLIFFG